MDSNDEHDAGSRTTDVCCLPSDCPFASVSLFDEIFSRLSQSVVFLDFDLRSVTEDAK